MLSPRIPHHRWQGVIFLFAPGRFGNLGMGRVEWYMLLQPAMQKLQIRHILRQSAAGHAKQLASSSPQVYVHSAPVYRLPCQDLTSQDQARLQAVAVVIPSLMNRATSWTIGSG